jgi:transposase-like protein
MKPGTWSLIRFQKRFLTEEDCLQYIQRLRWPNGFVCPKCQHEGGHRIKTRRVIQCANCRKQTSITANTIFHKTRLPLLNWLWIIYCVCQDKGGASATRLAKQLHMHVTTVWSMLHKIRKAMLKRDEPIRLSGSMELDEAYIGAEARKKGRKTDQTLCLVIVENRKKSAGNIALKIIDSISNENIEKVVSNKVEPNQYFKTDKLQAHFTLERMKHMLNAKIGSGVYAAIHLPLVHIAISLIKRFLMGTYHGVSRKYLQNYLAEFEYRFNRRFKGTRIFERLVYACISADSICLTALS